MRTAPFILLPFAFAVLLLAAGAPAFGLTEEQPCGLQPAARVGSHDVWWDEDNSVLVFRAGMTIDADGAPTAYAPDDNGLDSLKNAGRPGDWWALVTDIDGQPRIQGHDDPAPGYYVSTTALENEKHDWRDPRRYVDSERVPYIVLPRRLGLAHLGDFGAVIDPGSGAVTFAIYADIGPPNHLGEGSIALARALGVNDDARHGGTTRQLTYIVFAGSGNRRPREPQQIDEAGSALLARWGGLERATSCSEELARQTDGDNPSEDDAD